MTTRRATPESAVLRECLLAASDAGARLWRNNVGLFLTRDGRPARCGLCPDSADLIGLTASGRFLAVECKRPQGGRLTPGQRRWLDQVTRMGGLAIVARSGADVTRALEEEACQKDSR